MQAKGFVLTETIIVITVLCIIMITLYAAYSSVLIKVNKKAIYDNTEYIYKTNIIREYLENTLNRDDYESEAIYVVCSNANSAPCYRENTSSFQEGLFKELGTEAVYITEWNSNTLSDLELSVLEATTQSYIKSLDYNKITDVAYRIIIMFKDENNQSGKNPYQYATLRFGSRGKDE